MNDHIEGLCKRLSRVADDLLRKGQLQDAQDVQEAVGHLMVQFSPAPAPEMEMTADIPGVGPFYMAYYKG